ncbi:hypothetical protein [Alienimonas chondri]|uniref:Secreted protein n=1 Tax=Alienimonas chondri TaxID=2681879 RepID=A0ABX1VDR2_9PLAN|nr:hypothetical protein [Alienimonas chondri]NNJ26032.1 hypothetical protein [Alienimonas chondri]
MRQTSRTAILSRLALTAAVALPTAIPLFAAGCDSGPDGMGEGMPTKDEIIEANKALDGEDEGYRN